MENRKGVHVLYKNLGETPNEAILRFKKDNPEYEKESMTYAGRLDPMAEGLLLILSGDELQNKEKYLNLTKTYEFEILWGFETDTLDVLGLVSPGISFSSQVFRDNMISTNFQELIGKFEQSYPAYSSKPVKGKPLFQWAREGRLGDIEIPKHEVEMFDVQYLSRRTMSKEDLLKEIIYKVNSVSGDFRQKEILEKWQQVLEKTNQNEFVLDKITATVSSGFYIRQFVSDLAKSLGINGLTFHIKRTRVGDYVL